MGACLGICLKVGRRQFFQAGHTSSPTFGAQVSIENEGFKTVVSPKNEGNLGFYRGLMRDAHLLARTCKDGSQKKVE